jgi:hypothetical protein
MMPGKQYYLMLDGGTGVQGNPGLQERPFVVCAGEPGSCTFGSSSEPSSELSSSATSSEHADSSAVTSETSASGGSSAETSASSAGQECDHWANASAFLDEYCSEADTNEEMLTCYNGILLQWNGVVPGTPPPIPDINCSGTGDIQDVILLSDLVLSHYPITP